MNEALTYPDIGQRLIAIRQGFAPDLSQKAFADRHAFGHTQYNNWETGARRIPVDAAETLCEAYGLTLDFVYRGRRDGLSEKASKVL
jgi:transcriptional regulator with XRE-family HTH domain